MSLFETRKEKNLKSENLGLRVENTQLTRQVSELKWKLFKAYGREQEMKLADELNLSEFQRAKLAFLFSIEYARLMGAPEKTILCNKDEIDKFFTPVGES